jgi:hypothetical protein
MRPHDGGETINLKSNTMRKNLSVSPVNVVCFIAEAVDCPFVFVWVICFPLFDCLAPVGQSVLNGFAEQRTLAFVVVVVDDDNLCVSAVVHPEIYVTVVAGASAGFTGAAFASVPPPAGTTGASFGCSA